LPVAPLHVPAQGGMRQRWLDPVERVSAVAADATPLPFGSFSPALLGSPPLPLRAPYDPRPF